MTERRCKDCPPESKRPAPHPGPRCATCHRAWRKRASALAHGRRLLDGYGISLDEYWRLYEAQGGKCWICRVATGKARRLAVDHDHVSGAVRGLLCSPCNVMIGRLGPDAFIRVLDYLYNPPAIEVIGCRLVPSMGAIENANTLGPVGAKPTITDGGEPEV